MKTLCSKKQASKARLHDSAYTNVQHRQIGGDWRVSGCQGQGAGDGNVLNQVTRQRPAPGFLLWSSVSPQNPGFLAEVTPQQLTLLEGRAGTCPELLWQVPQMETPPAAVSEPTPFQRCLLRTLGTSGQPLPCPRPTFPAGSSLPSAVTFFPLFVLVGEEYLSTPLV